MQKKDSTTKKKGATSQAAERRAKRPHMEAELAVHIAAILAHPFTPAGLYNTVVEELAEMSSNIPASESTDTAKHIERILNWHQGLGFRSFGQYTEERLPDGRTVTRLKGGARFP